MVAERRITDVAQTGDPIAALRQRAEDYAPGDTDLAWTRTTPWRSLLAGALDTTSTQVISATVVAGSATATAALLRGWLHSRLGITPSAEVVENGAAIQAVELRLANGDDIRLSRTDHGQATLSQSGLPDRALPLTIGHLGDELAEELRRLDADQPYGYALEAATGTAGLNDRPGGRVHIWHDPTPAGVVSPA